MIDNSNGRKWARFSLGLALLMSVAGNVLHTVLAKSEIYLALRIPPAVLWPIFTFLGIEVLVRIIWEKSLTHRLARNMVLLPAIPAAVVSYEHLYSLLLLMGEEKFIAFIGPAAIDGTMIGMTMVLLFTRRVPEAPEAPEMQLAPSAPVLQYAEPIGPTPAPIVAEVREPEPEALPIPISPAGPRAPRALRSVGWDARAAAELAVDGAKAAEIVSKVQGMSSATAGLFVKVAAMLRANPAVEIPAKVTGRSVNPEYVRMMRDMIAR